MNGKAGAFVIVDTNYVHGIWAVVIVGQDSKHQAVMYFCVQ
jgi:hypothetical protein